MTWMVPCGHLHTVHPRIDLTLRLVLGDAIAFLDAADELVLLAADDGQVVFRQLAPLLLHLAGQLLPVAFDAIPIHDSLLSYADVLPHNAPATRGLRARLPRQNPFAPGRSIAHIEAWTLQIHCVAGA